MTALCCRRSALLMGGASSAAAAAALRCSSVFRRSSLTTVADPCEGTDSKQCAWKAHRRNEEPQTYRDNLHDD